LRFLKQYAFFKEISAKQYMQKYKSISCCILGFFKQYAFFKEIGAKQYMQKYKSESKTFYLM